MRKVFVARIAVLLLVLLMFFGSVYAQSYAVFLHEITVDVLEDGRADVTEKFYLIFPDDKERVSFRQLSRDYGSDLEKWKELNATFQPNIGNQDLINKNISYTEADSTYLELRYTLVDVLMAKGKETTNNVEYTLKATLLDNFYKTNVWVIPENTEITFMLPPRAELVGSVEPEAETAIEGTRQLVKWTGYKSANRLNLKYVSWNTTSIELSDIINSLFMTFEGQTLIIILAIAIIIIVVERKKISSRIEDFVINNSRLNEEEEEH